MPTTVIFESFDCPHKFLFPLGLEDLLEIRVAVDKLLLVRILQLVGLDVLPQGVDDDGPGLGVHPEQLGQPRVQLVLKEKDSQDE